jgi:hypothetical protein
LIKFFKKLFPQTKVIIQIRENIQAQSKSGWHKDDKNAPSYIQQMNKELIEFYNQNKIVAIGEYRRRFSKFGTFEDFQFSKKKFDAMIYKGHNHQIPAYMFVEFDDLFMFFKVEGSPIVKIMRRNHEVRTEECVCIPNESFNYIYELEM